MMENLEGKFANNVMYSDVKPYEIVKVISEQTIEVRAMNVKRDDNFKPEFIVGGFAGHCVNQNEQQWIITSCPEAETMRLRKRKDGNFYKGSLKFKIEDAPRYYYDYNF